MKLKPVAVPSPSVAGVQSTMVSARPPQARTTLAELGVVERLLELEPATSFGIRACWGQSDPYAIDFIFDASGTGCQVDRPRFDAMLASAAADAGAALVTGARLLALELERCCWQACVETAGQRRVFRARALVDATGRSALVARRLGVRRRAFDRLIGLVGLVDLPESAAVESNLLLEAVEDGWWYSAPLPRSRMTVAFMTDADLIGSRACASAFAARLRQAPYTTEREVDLGDPRVYAQGAPHGIWRRLREHKLQIVDCLLV